MFDKLSSSGTQIQKFSLTTGVLDYNQPKEVGYETLNPKLKDQNWLGDCRAP